MKSEFFFSSFVKTPWRAPTEIYKGFLHHIRWYFLKFFFSKYSTKFILNICQKIFSYRLKYDEYNHFKVFSMEIADDFNCVKIFFPDICAFEKFKKNQKLSLLSYAISGISGKT